MNDYIKDIYSELKRLLGTGHYLSPGGESEDFGLNTMKFSRSPL